MAEDSDNSFSSFEKAQTYACENDIDVFVDGHLVMSPSTEAVFNAVKKYNEEKMRNIIDAKFGPNYLATLGEECTDLCDNVIDSLKNLESTVADFKKIFEGINIAKWINSPSQKYTLLHFACRYNRADIVKLALDKGCSVEDKSFTGHYPAYYAINYNASREILDMLYKAPGGGDLIMRNELGPERFRSFKFNPIWTPNSPLVPEEFLYTIKSLVSRRYQTTSSSSHPLKGDEILLHHPDAVRAINYETTSIHRKKPRVDEEEFSSSHLLEGCEESNQETVFVKDIPRETMILEEEFECMICMEQPPDTIVHPCGHCVVCKHCSLGLRKTADKDRCVKCRQIIEWIDE